MNKIQSTITSIDSTIAMLQTPEGKKAVKELGQLMVDVGCSCEEAFEAMEIFTMQGERNGKPRNQNS